MTANHHVISAVHSFVHTKSSHSPSPQGPNAPGSSGDIAAVITSSANTLQAVVELQEVRLGGKPYLVDNNTCFVYEMTRGEGGVKAVPL